MHPLQAHNLYELSAASHAAASAAQLTDDIEQRAGLISAIEHLTSELKRITWELVENATDEESEAKKINPDLVAAFKSNPSDKTADAIFSAITPDLGIVVLSGATLTDGQMDSLVIKDCIGRFVCQIDADGTLTELQEVEW